jgi:23S rRNA-/tRNA-specific pseudouridylate synthase
VRGRGDERLRIRVLHRETGWLVVDKPAGIPTTSFVGPRPGGTQTGGPQRGGPRTGSPPHSLVERVRAFVPDTGYLHPLSRLDVEVTGVVLFALTHRAVEVGTKAKAAGRYERWYVGLLAAAPVPATGVWDLAISVDPRDATRRTTGPGEDTRAAVTEYRTLGVSPCGVALVEFRPRTGRTHQIRVHASAAGRTVLGDVAYGGARRVVLDDGTVVATPRVMLHAARVVIPGHGVTVEAPLPADFAGVWDAMGGEGMGGEGTGGEEMVRATPT